MEVKSMFIVGVHGDFIGKQETVFEASERVREAIENCKTFKGRIQFIRKLKKNKEERKKYFSAFSLVHMLSDFTDEQRKCYNKIKLFLR